MLDLEHGISLVGGWLVLIGVVTLFRRRRLSSAWVQRMRFWLGRNEDTALAEFDRAVLGWALIVFGATVLLFDLLG